MAAESTQVKNNIGGVLRIADGTGTPVTLTSTFDQGNMSLGPLEARLNVSTPLQRRGAFKSLIRGERIFPDFSMTFWVGNLVGSTAVAPGTALEMVFGKGAYSANVSTLGANREYTVDIRLTVEGTNWGDAADEMIDMEDVVCTITFQESIEGNTITITGKVLGAVVLTNNTNTVTLQQAA
jgi:hypothetical protein